uniref:Uncharacterized protein n=1 Tax=Corethron hystrix TaxID=216773 RepID=A0A6U5L6C1_9STRA|mmetsp:Transcript_43155/g.101187  ORF Transcript_43155/g.101187 Transcript_43155/m.101187 type:complete len:382 (+) Transcript_43155:812-1957(+)
MHQISWKIQERHQVFNQKVMREKMEMQIKIQQCQISTARTCDTETFENECSKASENTSKNKIQVEELKTKASVSNLCEITQNDSFDDDEVQIIEPSEVVKRSPALTKKSRNRKNLETLHSRSMNRNVSTIEEQTQKQGLGRIPLRSSNINDRLSPSALIPPGNMQRQDENSLSALHDSQVPFLNFSNRVTSMVTQNSPGYTREQIEIIVKGIWHSMSPEERKLYENSPSQDFGLPANDQRILTERSSVNRPMQLSYLDQIRRSENRLMTNYFDQLPHESEASILLREEQLATQLRRQGTLNHVAMLRNPAQHQSLQHQLMNDNFGLHMPRGFPSGISEELALMEHERRRQEEIQYLREFSLDPAAGRLLSDYDLLGRGTRR